MSRYTILPSQHGQGYRIEVVDARGSRHTMLGFDTENEAVGWVEADKRRERRLGADFLTDTAD
jgi:hypothetical protein